MTTNDTGPRLERRQAGTVYVHGDIVFASGFQSSLSLPHTEWEALEAALAEPERLQDAVDALDGAS